MSITATPFLFLFFVLCRLFDGEDTVEKIAHQAAVNAGISHRVGEKMEDDDCKEVSSIQKIG
jgi:hypothetical protein